jgi:hypothetical protein
MQKRQSDGFRTQVDKFAQVLCDTSTLVAALEFTENTPSDVHVTWEEALKLGENLFSSLGRLLFQVSESNMYQANAEIAKAAYDFHAAQFQLQTFMREEYLETLMLAQFVGEFPHFLEVLGKHPGNPSYTLMRHLLYLSLLGHKDAVNDLREMMFRCESLKVYDGNQMAAKFLAQRGLPVWRE